MDSFSIDPVTQQRQPVRPSFSGATYVPSETAPEPFFGRGPTKVLGEKQPVPDGATGTIPLLGVKEDLPAGEVGEGSSGLGAIAGKVPWQDPPQPRTTPWVQVW
jgi:hypothetical protein